MNESSEPAKVKENELFAFEVQKMSKQHTIYMMFRNAKAYVDQFQFKDA
jgi:hypothetical protein